MKKINNILKKNNIIPLKYEKRGKVIIVFTKDKKYVIKETKKEIFEYLLNRHFDNYPKTIIEDNYAISLYIEDNNILKEQKILDLINLVSLLHLKTTCYEKININDIKEIYEDKMNEINDLTIYYNNLMDIIETKIFMSPKEYTLARNISLFLNNLSFAKNKLDEWYRKFKNKSNYRIVLLHNNLKLDHLINNMLISFEKAKFGLPIFDIYNLYKNTYDDFDFIEIYKLYIKNYPLNEDEVDLLLILLIIPQKITFQNIEYLDTILVYEEVNYLDNSLKLVDSIKKLYLPKDKKQ